MKERRARDRTFDPLERIRGLNGPFLRQDIAHPPDEPGRGRTIYPPAGVCQKRPASLSGYCPVGDGPPGAETPGHDDQDEGFSSVRRPIRMGGSWEGAISGQKGWHRMGIRSYTAAFGWLIGWRAAQSVHRIKICGRRESDDEGAFRAWPEDPMCCSL